LFAKVKKDLVRILFALRFYKLPEIHDKPPFETTEAGRDFMRNPLRLYFRSAFFAYSFRDLL
jgi:hypothetical protein